MTDWEKSIDRYETYIRVERSLSKNSIASYLADINEFQSFITLHYDIDPRQVEASHIESYLCGVYDKHLKKSTQARKLSTIKSFFRFMVIDGVIDTPPTEFIDSPKIGRDLPDTLSTVEIDKIIASIDLSKISGHRDRAIIELLYSCGLRVSEATELKLSDIFVDEGIIRVHGKGDKQRLVPISHRAQRDVENYLLTRKEYPRTKAGENRLFLNLRGNPLSRVSVFTTIQRATTQAGIEKSISPHTFRHSFATHLLQGGASIRQVQELLGHESVTTTEIYTHINRDHLHSSVDKFHPLAGKNK